MRSETILAKSSKQSTKGNNYALIIPIVGILILFLSVIALLEWGALGKIFINVIRLFIGEAYPLMMVVFIFAGGYLIWKRSLTDLRLVHILGILLIFSALTTSLHFNEFFPQEPLARDIYSETFQIFRNEFLANQVKVSMGGGLLGAIYYSICGYLFGRWGTYLLSLVLFTIGLTFVEPYGLTEIGLAIKEVANTLSGFFSKAGHQIKRSKEIVDARLKKDDTVAPEHIMDEQDSWEVESFESEEGLKRRQSMKEEGFFHKVRSMFETPETPMYSESYEDTQEKYCSSIKLTPGEKPAMDYNPHRKFDSFNQGAPLAKTALRERQKHPEVVLDLDYFESMYPPSKANATHERVRINRYDHREFQGDDAKLLQTPEDSEIASQVDKDSSEASEPMTVRNHSQMPSQEIEASMPSHVPDVELLDSLEDATHSKSSHSGDLPPEHWKNQANTHQRLTDDELELSLSQAEKDKVITTSTAKRQKPTTSYHLPGKDLLTKRPPVDQTEEYERINQNIDKLEQTFKSFGVDAKVVKANLGPAVTKYEIEPAVGVKVSKIVSLTDDIALALAARDIRMEAPIPGKSYIGIEVPNSQVSPVSFDEIVDASLNSEHILEVPLGRDVAGAISTADLSKMPHLLIAGSTGSGKSVGMNIIICSLLMKAKPEEVKFLMIDPKKVELTMYNDIPHLLSPVVTNPRKAAKALNQVVVEMEDRYEKFAKANVRNQDSYNEYVERMNTEEGIGLEKMPKIVVFIDELADLMLVAGNEVENAIIRLAQMARAAGIHMIIATQRPSVDVITGIIKANIPSRLAFAVTSGTDSRTILDANGAEKLLGKGDMLFQPISMNKPVRVQGAYISDAEVERITNFIKDQRPAEYDEKMIITDEKMTDIESSEDEYFEDAVDLIKDQETVSISQIQRKFRVGYNRAARIIDDLEALGYIGPADGSKPRQVYINE